MAVHPYGAVVIVASAGVLLVCLASAANGVCTNRRLAGGQLADSDSVDACTCGASMNNVSSSSPWIGKSAPGNVLADSARLNISNSSCRSWSPVASAVAPAPSSEVLSNQKLNQLAQHKPNASLNICGSHAPSGWRLAALFLLFSCAALAFLLLRSRRLKATCKNICSWPCWQWCVKQTQGIGGNQCRGTHCASSGVQQCPSKQQHASQVCQEQHAGVPVQVNRCPFGHGSVGTGPFPGYVHGKNPAICANGCTPDPMLGKHGHTQETPRQTLVREALEFQDSYHADKGTPAAVKEARVQQILADIETTGSYTHTFDELQHGARMAWRNAPKCSNRKFWEELRLIDGRSATKPAEMYDVCLELLEKAGMSCVTTANIAVFRPQTPGSSDGPRVWNNQLIRFAGYQPEEGGKVVGDPAEAGFTKMLQDEFGWKPPCNPGRFDVLPLVLQAHPDERPQVFELPSQYVVRVPIRHPINEAITALGLQWYAVPAVSSMELSVGGITYTAAPFNGWYADTEIVRNLTDEGRYNVAADVAACLGLDTHQNSSLWRDRAVAEVGVAVMNSFKEAGMGMVDHHTLMDNFYNWWHKEKRTRGYSPGNWKWIITPMSASSNRCYLGLNKMTEYTLKPGYWYAPGWQKYRQALQPADASVTVKLAARQDDSGTPAAVAAEPPSTLGGVGAKPQDANKSLSVVLAYATVTGNTQQYAEAVARLLGKAGSVKVELLNMEDFEAERWTTLLGDAQLLLVLTSTHGPGACPSSANKFINWLKQHGAGKTDSVLHGKPFCVLGFGSSSYPRFCAAADRMQAAILAATGSSSALLPPAKADAEVGEDGVVWPWLRQLVAVMQEGGWLSGLEAQGLEQGIPTSGTATAQSWKPLYDVVTLDGANSQTVGERGLQWATVKSSTELLGSAAAADTGSSTKLLALDVGAAPACRFSPGDEVAVWAENDAEVVVKFAAGLGIPESKLDTMFMLQRVQGDSGVLRSSGYSSSCTAAPAGRFPQPNTFRRVLSLHLGLAERLKYSDLSALAKCAADDAALQQLVALSDQFDTWAAQVQPRWMDLFKLFPSLVGRIPLATFFSLVPVMQPRYYSVASYPAATPEELSLCVGLHKHRLPNGQIRLGACSSFLNNLVPGSQLRFKVISQPAFRLPFDSKAPVVMFAAGTGIAPLKGFWEERAARQQQGQHLGPAVLLFGCRSANSDLLFGETLTGLVQRGVLSKVLTAFSREPGVPKTYVQDLIAQHATDLQPLLTHPKCHVYISGSNNMAVGVNEALEHCLGKDVFAALVEDGRLHEEVFGTASSSFYATPLPAATDATNTTPASPAGLGLIPSLAPVAVGGNADNGGVALLPASSDELPACQSDAPADAFGILIRAPGTGLSFNSAQDSSTDICMARDDGSMAGKDETMKGAGVRQGGSRGRAKKGLWGLFRVGGFAGCYGGSFAGEEAG